MIREIRMAFFLVFFFSIQKESTILHTFENYGLNIHVHSHKQNL